MISRIFPALSSATASQSRRARSARQRPASAASLATRRRGLLVDQLPIHLRFRRVVRPRPARRLRRRHPARDVGKRLRGANRALQAVVDFFTVQTEARVAKLHSVSVASQSEPSARPTSTDRSSPTPATRTSHGLQHTSQSCTKRAAHVGLEVDLRRFAAVRAFHREDVIHGPDRHVFSQIMPKTTEPGGYCAR